MVTEGAIVKNKKYQRTVPSTAELQIAVVRFFQFKMDERSGRMFVTSVYCGRRIYYGSYVYRLNRGKFF